MTLNNSNYIKCASYNKLCNCISRALTYSLLISIAFRRGNGLYIAIFCTYAYIEPCLVSLSREHTDITPSLICVASGLPFS